MSSPPALVRPGRRRYVSVIGGTLSMLLAASFVTTGSAQAATGAAPEPRTLTRIGDVHTDAISTFFEGGNLVLGSRADTPASGTRYDNDDIFFHVDDAAKIDSAPAGAAFVAPAGTPVWLVPQTQEQGQIWPGFSTESVPTGTLIGDETTFTLQGVEGPGDVELWQTGALGAPSRLWSSDEKDFKKFTRGRVHLHGNWAFTAPGTYRLTVRADATASATEQAVSDTEVYTFVVGEVPDAVDTATTLTSSASSVLDGDPVTLTSTVTPAGIDGAVEFRDGATILGHDPVDATGKAELTVPRFAVGDHNITSVFKPAIANSANSSTSAAVNVTVTDASGEPFSIRGLATSYEPGDALQAHVIGKQLEQGATTDGQRFRWMLRPVGSTSSGSQVQAPSTANTVSAVVDASHEGYELSALVRQCANATCTSGPVVAQTAWVPLDVVPSGPRPSVTRSVGSGPVYPGDTYEMVATDLALAEGETNRFVFRSSSTWTPNLSAANTSVSNPSPETMRVLRVGTNIPFVAYSVAVQVMRDGVAVRQSAPTTITYENFELPIAGLQTLYLGGTSARLSAQIYPERPANQGLSYRWQFSKVASFSTEDPSTMTWAEGRDMPAVVARELNVSEHNEGYVRVQVLRGEVDAFATSPVRVYVTDDPSAQLFFIDNLAAHYHQGDKVDLNLTASPEPQADDAIVWEWKWPGADWAPLPGVFGTSHSLRAEQALHGVQVRATLDFAAQGKDSVISDPVTIGVDDHGAAARQKPTITGETAVAHGDRMTLARELPANGSTVLTQHRWERRTLGAVEFSTVEGETGATLSFPASMDDDRAQYRVSILSPHGRVAYGPSPAVDLSVTGAPPPAPAATTITAPRVTQTYGKPAMLAVAVSPAPTGTVRMTAGRKTVSAQLEQGRATFRLPVKSLDPGSRSVTVTYDGVPGTFAATTQTVPVTVRKATPKVRVKVSTTKVARGRMAKFVVTATAPGVRPTGRVTVKVAGTTNTVRLDSRGKAVVRVKIGRKASTGKHAVSVRYRGSAHVAQAKAPTKRVNVTR